MKQVSADELENLITEYIGEVASDVLLSEQVLERKANLKYNQMVENIISEEVVKDAQIEIEKERQERQKQIRQEVDSVMDDLLLKTVEQAQENEKK